jgi:hypothetical protein
MSADREPPPVERDGVTVVFASAAAALRLGLVVPLDAEDGSADSGAVRARVVVEAGPFRGEFGAVVWPFDLRNLRRALGSLAREPGEPDRALAVECAFVEGNLVLSARPDERGAVPLHVRVTPNPADADPYDDPPDGVRLTFTVDADRTDLQRWLAALDSALSRFPVRDE